MKKTLPVLFLLACAAAFALGLAHLFKLRFEAGDVYPEYSSLRADPLGTMAFYESLERLPGVSVRRDFSAANRLPEGKDTTYLHLAGHTYEWREFREDLFREVERFLAGGGRLVIMLFPETVEPFMTKFLEKADEHKADEKNKDQKQKPSKPVKKRKALPKEGDDRIRRVSVKERWGVEFDHVPLEQGDGGAYEPALAANQGVPHLPATLNWHSSIVLTNLDKSWHVIYARGRHPILAERKFGRGTVVLATDSYLVSNEAILDDRHADLLAWLVGPNRHVVFDEAHLGIAESPGIAALIRKYRLHGTVAALILLAGLFIWKNAFSLAPPHQDEEVAAYVAGKDSAAGFVSLLRRNIPANRLLQVCLAEWKKTLVHGQKSSAGAQHALEAIAQVEDELPAKQRAPVEAYRTLCEILKRNHGLPDARPARPAVINPRLGRRSPKLTKP